MADTGWVFPGTVAGDRSFPHAVSSTRAWTDHNNIKIDDANDATWVVTETSSEVYGHGLYSSNFDFSSIPSTAHIDGIEVEIGDYSESGISIIWWSNHILSNADASDGERPFADPTAPDGTVRTEIIGSATVNAWNGVSVTDAPRLLAADVKDSDFGVVNAARVVASQFGASTLSVNYVKMRVSYHESFPAIIGWNGIAGHHPPFKSSGGAFYAVTREQSTINIYKSTDTDGAWTEQDYANRPANLINTIGCVSAVQDGDVIHMAWYSSLGPNTYRYGTFDMSTDLWDILGSGNGEILQASITAQDAPEEPWCSIAGVRADGEIIVAYAGAVEKIMGGNKGRVDFARRTATDTWSGPTALDAAGDIHYGNPNCVLGTSNGTHFIWQTTSNTTDPPAAWTDSQGRTLDSANSLSTVDVSASDTGPRLLGNPNALSYDDGGTQIVLSLGAAVDSFEIGDGTEDGSNDLLLSATALTESISPDIYGNDTRSILSFAVGGENATDIHCLYSGGGTAGVDQDIYYTKSTDNAVNWSTPTEEIDGITCNFISATIYVNGSDTVLAYLYDDEGVQKYNEKILIAGAVEPYLPYFPERTNTLLRM